jgi:hypothetical protein
MFTAVVFQVKVFWAVTLCTLNKEAAWTYETLVPHHDTAWHHNPEDLNLFLFLTN